MTRLATSLAALCLCSMMQAQNLRIWQGGTYTLVPATLAQEMAVESNMINFAGQHYTTDEIDSITVSHERCVVVSWAYGDRLVDGDKPSATVYVPEGVSGVTYKVNGANVSITSTNTSDEIEYLLQGYCPDGSLLFNGEYKCTFTLNNLDLSSKATAPIDIECGKRIAMQMLPNTINTLTDTADGDQKAALYTKGHLELSGAGTLNVTGRAKHAIATKEYLQIKRSAGAINILAAESDGIHAGQYFQMNGGTLTITGNKGDAIQAEVTKDETDENNGQIIIKGGTITCAATEGDTKCLKADSDVTISGGTLTLTASGAGSRGIQTDGNVLFNEKDGALLVNITASGDQYDDGSGDKSRCWGIKAKGNITREAGTVNVKASGKAKTYKADGTVTGM